MLMRVPPIDWQHALCGGHQFTAHERQRTMFWLVRRGWKRLGASESWLDPVDGDDADFLFAMRVQAARDVQTILEPQGWVAYGRNTRPGEPWWHHTRVRRGSVRCSLFEALQRELAPAPTKKKASP